MDNETSGPPAIVQGTGQIACQDDLNCGCQALTDAGSVCGESQSLKIIEEFQQLYEDRLRGIEEEVVGDGIPLKIKTLTSWVRDLGEQNAMLVQTVEQLEQEAANRVAVLEERLQHSSHIALEYMTKLQDYDTQIKEITGEKVQSESLEVKASARLMVAQQTEEILRTRVRNLQNDITGLLELIRRARQDGSWDVDGLNFREVTYEDIFGSYPYKLTNEDEAIIHMCTEVNTLKVSLKGTREGNVKNDMILLQEKVTQQQNDILSKDAHIKRLIEKIQKLRDSISHKCDEEAVDLSDHSIKIEQVDMKIADIEADIEQNHVKLQQSLDNLCSTQAQALSMDGIENHRRLLEENHSMIQILFKKVNSLVQNSQSYIKSMEDLEDNNVSLKLAVDKYEKDLKPASMNILGKETSIMKLQNSLNECGGSIDVDLACLQKKGVSFSTPSVAEYEEKIEELNRKLKAQKDTELTAKMIPEINNDVMVPARLNFAKEIAEFRVKTVIAQAALEEMKDEFDNLLENLKYREEKIEKLGEMLQNLQSSLILPGNDTSTIDIHKKSEKECSVIGEAIKIQEAKISNLKTIIESAASEVMMFDTKIKHIFKKHSEVIAQGNTTPEAVVKEFAEYIENMGAWGRKIFDELQVVLNVESNLLKVHLQLKNILLNKNEYVYEKHIFDKSCKNSEQKIEKLQEELESVQEDMQQCIEALQPGEAEEDDCD